MTPFNPSSATTRVHLRASSRLNRIHQEIVTGRCPTTGRLAELLERSERTVKRELRELRNGFNAPLHYDRAAKGWRYRDPGWEFQARITEGDLLAFFAAEHALRAVGHTPEATLMRAGLAKLAALLPEEVSINLNTLGEALTSQATPHVMVEATTLAALGRAAIERRTISFDYHSQHRNEHTHREADVLLLHNFAGDWYAIAYDHLRREVRDFHAGQDSYDAERR